MYLLFFFFLFFLSYTWFIIPFSCSESSAAFCSFFHKTLIMRIRTVYFFPFSPLSFPSFYWNFCSGDGFHLFQDSPHVSFFLLFLASLPQQKLVDLFSYSLKNYAGITCVQLQWKWTEEISLFKCKDFLLKYLFQKSLLVLKVSYTQKSVQFIFSYGYQDEHSISSFLQYFPRMRIYFKLFCGLMHLIFNEKPLEYFYLLFFTSKEHFTFLSQ